MSRIFLSYARGDDEGFVRRLHDDLSAEFDVWFDRESMPSRGLTFHQEIRDAVSDCERLVLVVGPHAFQSVYVQQEWQYAWYKAEKAVTPILRLGDYSLVPDELKLLHCEDFRDDVQYEVHLRNLIRQLSEPLPPLGKLIAVPSLPPHFLARSDRLKVLRDALRADLEGPTVTSGAAARIGVHGMGGIGKSVLAAALGHDRRVRQSFSDGIVWVRIGQTRNIVDVMREVDQCLDGDGVFENVREGQDRLRNRLKNKCVLLILDDVWRRSDVEAFDVLGPRCRAFFTTRDAGLLTSLGGVHHVVELLTDAEATRILAVAAGIAEQELPNEARQIVSECGRLPLAVSLCGTLVRRGISWRLVLQQLQQARLDRIGDRHAVESQHQNVWHAIHVSVESLQPDERDRFLDLSIFPPDEATSEVAVATLWEESGGLDDWESAELLTTFAERSLVELTKNAESSAARSFSLHPLIYDYASREAGELSQRHDTLLSAYKRQCYNDWSSGPNDGYFFNHLAWHLREAGKWQELRSLLLSFAWIEAKLNATDTVQLLLDFGQYPNDKSLELVQCAIRMSAHYLEADKSQLPSQVCGRIVHSGNLEMEQIIQSTIAHVMFPWIRCRSASLPQAGAPLSRTLERETKVDAMAVTPDGKYVVTQSFSDLNVWEIDTGKKLHTFYKARPLGMTNDRITAVAVTPDSKHVVAGGEDGTLKIWELQSGELLRTFAGKSFTYVHNEALFRNPRFKPPHCIKAVAVTLDGKNIVSGGDDSTLKIWEFETGKLLRTLKGHESAIKAVALTCDCKLVSASWRTLKLWEMPLGTQLRTFEVNFSINGMTLTPDSKKLVFASGLELRVLELETGRELLAYQGHSFAVTAVAVTPDTKQLVSASVDKTIKLWELGSGKEVSKFEAGSPVKTLAMIPNGKKVISSARDLNIWDLQNDAPAKKREGHFEAVTVVVVTPDGQQAISGSMDQLVKVWDVETGQELRTLSGHSSAVSDVVVTPDGKKVISGSLDSTIIVWDLQSGQELWTFTGHKREVQELAVTSDGKHVISASKDTTFKVWDLGNSREVYTLPGHWGSDNFVVVVTPDCKHIISAPMLAVWELETGRKVHDLQGDWIDVVSAIAVADDGKYAVAAGNTTLFAWDLRTGKRIGPFQGHYSIISALTVAPNGQAVSAYNDGTMKVWELTSGVELGTLNGHSDEVNAVRMTPDGRQVVSISKDATLKVWDLQSCCCVATFAADHAILACNVLPSGKVFVAGDASGAVHFLELSGKITKCPNLC